MRNGKDEIKRELDKFWRQYAHLDNQSRYDCTLDYARELCRGYGFSGAVALELSERVSSHAATW